MPETIRRPLSYMLALVGDRIGGEKDPSKPYVGLEHIPSAGSSLLGVGAASDSISTNTLFVAGDILFGKLRPRLRKSIRAKLSGYCSTDVLVLRPTGSVDPAFAGFVAQSDAVFSRAIQTEEGTKMPRCSWRDLKNVDVFCPVEKAPQERIADILTSIDTAIEKTEALIVKYQHIKAGLMHDLFTRGVLPSGRLRPPREQAPELYQEFGAAWVPRAWQLSKFRHVLIRIDSGWSPDCEEKPPSMGEWGVLKVSAVTRGKYVASESKTLPQTMRPDASIEVTKGDVILTRANGVAELVGLTVQVRDTPPRLMLSDKLLRLVPVDDLLTKDFLALLMQSRFIKSQIESVMSGSSGQRNISQAQINRFKIALPPLEEQLLIGERMRSIELVLECEELAREKLIQKKLGLMQDLLTGKVPVKVTEPAPEPLDA